MAELNLKSGAGSPRRFPLADKPLRIGRSRENDVSLPDQWLSRHHAEVHPGERGYYLRDLGSKNGTLLNDALLELVKKGQVEPEEAFAKSVAKSELRQQLDRAGFKLNATSD